LDLEPELEPKLELEVQEMAQERSLSNIFYPPMIALSSCFTIPDVGQNVIFELRPYYTQMLPKFMALEDTYLFLREFEKVCSMMHFPNIPIDVV